MESATNLAGVPLLSVDECGNNSGIGKQSNLMNAEKDMLTTESIQLINSFEVRTWRIS